MVWTVFLLFLGSTNLWALDPSEYGDYTPTELIERSWGSPSRVEKLQIRSYLAKNHPDTAAGLFSQAWVWGYEKNDPNEQAYYETCLERYPDFIPAIYNFGASTTAANAKTNLARIERTLARDPSAFSYELVRIGYFNIYKSAMKNRQGARDFLEEWEQRLGSDIYIFDFIRGIEQESTFHNYEKALGYYQQATEKKGGSERFELWKRMMDLQMEELFDPSRQTNNDKFKYLQQLVNHALNEVGIDTRKGRIFSYKALEYANKKLAKMGDQSSTAYRQAFKVYPTVEMAETVLFAIRNELETGQDERCIQWLQHIERQLPQSAALNALLGWGYLKTGRLQKAEAYYQKAVDTTLTQQDKWTFAREFATKLLVPSLRYDQAVAAVKPFSNDGPNQLNALYYLANFESLAKNYKTAKGYITRFRQGRSDGKYTDLEKSIDSFMETEQEIKNFQQGRFEGRWRQRYGESLKFSINFAVNSAVIPQRDYGKLQKIADIFAEQEAESFSFRIEGHTDSSGSDAINDPLSVKRARAVAELLRQRHGIPSVRMETFGFGSHRPIVSNATKTGRAQNRRVEIMLGGNLSQPELAVTTTLSPRRVDVSTDGKYILMRKKHETTFELWEVATMRKIKEFPGMLYRPRFSPNNRYIAFTNAHDADIGSINVVDVQTGQLIAQQPFEGHSGFRSIAWSPFSNEFAVATKYGDLFKYNLEAGKLTASGKIFDLNNLGTLVWTPDGKYICMNQRNQGGDVQIYHAKDLGFVKSFKNVSWPHALGITSDSRFLVCADNQRVLHVWDLQNGFTHRSMRIPTLVGTISAHPNQHRVILNDWGGVEHNKAAIVDLDAMRVEAIKDVGTREKVRYFYLRGGAEVLMASEEPSEIRFLDPDNLRDRRVYTGESAEATGRCHTDTAGHHLVTHDDEGLHVWDVKAGKKAHAWFDEVYAIENYPGRPNQFIGLIEDRKKSETRVVLYDFANYTKKKLLTLDYKVHRWGIQAGGLLLAGTPYMPIQQGSKEGKIRLYDLGSLQLQNEITFPMATEVLRYPRLYSSDITGLEMSPDKTRVMLATKWQDGWKRPVSRTKYTRIISLETGKLIRKLPATKDSMGFIGNRQVKIGKGIYDLESGERVGDAPNLEELPYPYNIGSHWSFGDKEATFKDLNLKIVPGMDNTLRVINLKDDSVALTMAAKRQNEWIAFAPDGRFTASLSGTHKVYWRVGERFLPFEALREQYDTPRLIQRLLEARTSDEPTPKKKKPQIDPELFKAPYEIRLVADKAVETRKGSYVMTVAVKKDSVDLPDPQLEFTLNGRVIKKGRGFEVVPVKKGPVTLDVTREFNLQDGLNVLRVSLVYKQARLQSQSVEVTKITDQPPTRLMSSVQLWFFGVGVSDYEQPEQNLDYAHKDVLELAASLKKQEGKLFQKVNIKTLVNEEATEKAVRIGMHRFLKLASSQDVIIIFLAGHGVQDNEQNLYFMSHDGILKDPYTGMEFAKFETFLKSRPINQKAILMMDICHAGSAGLTGKRRGGVTAEEAVKQLSDGTGTIVFASSTGRESSLEDASFGGGHGAFTAALLEGLEGEADRKAGDNNRYIGIFELINYVSRRVPEITDGNQHPTTPQSLNVRDFPIYAY